MLLLHPTLVHMIVSPKYLGRIVLTVRAFKRWVEPMDGPLGWDWFSCEELWGTWSYQTSFLMNRIWDVRIDSSYLKTAQSEVRFVKAAGIDKDLLHHHTLPSITVFPTWETFSLNTLLPEKHSRVGFSYLGPSALKFSWPSHPKWL